MRMTIALSVFAQAAQADQVDAIATAAQDAFARMPDVIVVQQMAGNCGATAAVDDRVAYCTSRNAIFMTAAARTLPEVGYLLGHAYGHAVQVQHGVADFAWAQIRARRSEEAMLRGLVERQVDCIAEVERSG